jgi:hypothetical protein
LSDAKYHFFAGSDQFGTKIVASLAGQNSAPQSYSFLTAKWPKSQIKVLKNENLDQKICQFKNSRYICGVEFSFYY